VSLEVVQFWGLLRNSHNKLKENPSKFTECWNPRKIKYFGHERETCFSFNCKELPSCTVHGRYCAPWASLPARVCANKSPPQLPLFTSCDNLAACKKASSLKLVIINYNAHCDDTCICFAGTPLAGSAETPRPPVLLSNIYNTCWAEEWLKSLVSLRFILQALLTLLLPMLSTLMIKSTVNLFQ
jgi:hypothetical protein